MKYFVLPINVQYSKMQQKLSLVSTNKKGKLD